MNDYHDKAALIIDLQMRGYHHDFIIYKEGLLCIQGNDIIPPDEFEVIETYHFKSNSEEADDYIVYAISPFHYDMKGILMTSFGSYNRGVSIHLWSKLSYSIKKAMDELKDRSFKEVALN